MPTLLPRNDFRFHVRVSEAVPITSLNELQRNRCGATLGPAFSNLRRHRVSPRGGSPQTGLVRTTPRGVRRHRHLGQPHGPRTGLRRLRSSRRARSVAELAQTPRLGHDRAIGAALPRQLQAQRRPSSPGRLRRQELNPRRGRWRHLPACLASAIGEKSLNLKLGSQAFLTWS